MLAELYSARTIRNTYRFHTGKKKVDQSDPRPWTGQYEWYELSLRSDNLKWAHHKEVAALDEEKQEYYKGYKHVNNKALRQLSV